MKRTLMTILALAVTVSACGKKQPPVVVAPAPAPATADGPGRAGGPPVNIDKPLPVPPEPRVVEDAVTARSLDDINLNSPLKPVYFLLDSAELDDAGRAIVGANAEILKKNATWVVTIEGHCDERGSAEYNLALGERRAQAAKTYLTSLGIPENRVKTVSYGKEYPFDPGHTEEAWAKNRRGHFVVTSR